VVINEEREYAVAVGAQPRTSACASGLIFIDMKDPSNPTSPGCAAQDGYVHDAQCIVYRGPDARYAGRDICYGYNEDTLTIYDVTDKNATKIISRTGYTGASYTHQGWVLDPNNQEYLLLDDEYDEYDGAGPAADGFPVTYIFNIRSLEQPVLSGYYKSKQKSVDHNQYVANGKAYQSNYAAGLRVLDVSSIPADPTGNSVSELGFFDVYPEDDNTAGLVDFVGSWSNYGLFKSGHIAINSIERGLFVVKLKQ
jgi:choice-of-anchor B domain-containing protein